MTRMYTGIPSPMPDGSNFKTCKCGQKPRWGMNDKDLYRIFCLRLKTKGCRTSTDYYETKDMAIEDWETVANK